MDTAIQIGQHGRLTLPDELRQKYGIRDGDFLRIIELDGVLVLTPITSTVAHLAAEIEKARLAAGLSIQDLLVSLQQQRRD